MPELSVRSRKRDKAVILLGLGRSAPPKKFADSHNAGASNAPPVHAPEASPSSTNLAAPLASSASVASTTDPADTQPIPSTPSTPTPTPLARGLWLDALQKLSGVDQQAIQSIQLTQGTQQPLSERIQDLVSMTKKKQHECENDSYKFFFQGREIILRDVAGKIIFWLNKFKDVGHVAVNFDPIHASLPWAGVRFLLQAAVGGHEQMGALLVSIEKVTYLTNRCTIYESLYKSGTTPGQELHNFNDALVELYAAILRLIALANRLFAKNTVIQAIHALINPGEISDLLTKCQDQEDRVEKEAQNCERKRSQKVDAKTQELLKSLRLPTLRTYETVSSLLEKVDEKECLEILDWISKVLYGKNHNTVKDQRTKDTCEWLLRHNRYLEWQNTSSSMILWLHGTAGTGKTYLTSKVIDELRDTLQSNPNHEGLAFFYCNRNETERQEPLLVLRSFVRQLSTIIQDESSIRKRLKQFYYQTRAQASEPTLGDCKNLLLEFINLYSKTTLVLDALDECDKDKRDVLIEIFEYFLAHASRPVKIFISSRPDGDIRGKFKSRPNVEIKATDNHKDISEFIMSEITRHSRWNRMSSELQKDIVETLQERSQGMFQWAYLQIKQLSNLKQERLLRERLGKLPEDLKDAYHQIYNGMIESERQIADRAFQWVMCSCTPLSTDVLLQAVCQDEEDDTIKHTDGELDEDDLLEYCQNLLVIDAERKVWIPSHLSVIEYFESQLWSQTQANCLVSSVCLLLLNDIVHYDPVNTEQDYSMPNDSLGDPGFGGLSRYASHHWVIHVQKCQEEGGNERVSNLLKRFLGSRTDSSPAYQIWHRIIRKDQYRWPHSSIFWKSRTELDDLGPTPSATFTICAFGFHTILSDWWDNPWTEYTHKTSSGNTLLQLAAKAGSVSICRRFIDWSVDVNEKTGNYCSALATAAYWGKKEVVELLIKSGAEVNTQLRGGYYSSALEAAASGAKKEVVELLIKSGAEVKAQLLVGEYGSALAAAAFGGEKEVVKLLIKCGVEVNAQLLAGNFGCALAAAAFSGEKEAVELLIESGADVNAQLQSGCHGSALAAAAFGGKKEVVELLIKSGAEMESIV